MLRFEKSKKKNYQAINSWASFTTFKIIHTQTKEERREE